ncbi:MAG: hypothetical protein RL701_4616 [Pseudomonadota bacterium]
MTTSPNPTAFARKIFAWTFLYVAAFIFAVVVFILH